MDNLRPQEWCPVEPVLTGSYCSVDDAKVALQDHAIRNGFALVVGRSKPNLATFICSQGGGKRSHKPNGWAPQEGRRTLHTKKVGCKYSIKLEALSDSVWVITTPFEEHSGHYFLSEREIGALPAARRYLMGKHCVGEVIVRQSESGVPPRAIWADLRGQYLWVTYKNVDNTIAKHKKSKWKGLTQIEALHNLLKTELVVSESLRDNDNRLIRLFVAPNASRNLTQRYCDVLLMDCIYQLNKHRMLLLHVVGVTGMHNHFTVGYCFMDNETEPSYNWSIPKLERALPHPPSVVVIDDEAALISALETTWPNCRVHLCRWHIEKNITANCKKLGMNPAAFNALMKGWRVASNYTATESEFMAKWSAVKTDLLESIDNPDYVWLHNPPDEVSVGSLQEVFNYIDTNKVSLRDRFASYAINQFQHFGHTVTSIVEGAHWTNIKSKLRSSRGTLLDVYERIQISTKQRQLLINEQLNRERVDTLSMPTGMFEVVLRGVTHHALKYVHLQYTKALHPDQLHPCTNYERNVMGLPCAHEIAALIQSKSLLTMSMFHRHWHKEKIGIDPDIHGVLEPFRVERLRGRPPQTTKTKKNRTTSRLPSAFELVEAATTCAVRKCTICRQPGHNNKTCEEMESK